MLDIIRHSRESGNPASLGPTPLGPRFRGDDGIWAVMPEVKRSVRELD